MRVGCRFALVFPLSSPRRPCLWLSDTADLIFCTRGDKIHSQATHWFWRRSPACPKPRKVLPPAGVQPQPPSGPSHPSLVFENNPQIDVRLSAFDRDPVNRAMSIGRFVHPDPSQAASMSPEDLLRWKAAASSCTSSILKMAALSIPRVGIETPSRLLHCLELFGQLQISLLSTDLPSKWDSYDSIVASFDKLVAGGYTVKDNLEYVVACDRTFQGTKQMFQILAKK